MSRLLDDLRDAVGGDAVVDDADVLAGHEVDWTGRFRGRAAALVRPSTTEDVAALLAVCRRHATPVVPQGGNTGLVGGAVPGDGAVVVHLGRFDRITDVDPDAGQLTAGAGVTVAAVQGAADAAGWRYGVDLAARDTATIGGTVATNAGGLRVLRHGMTRHQLVGVEAALGTGGVLSDLRGLVKDNTGYDLAGLLCGSEGTLGIVTAVRVRLVPAAGSTVTAQVGVESMADAVSLAGRLRREVPTLEAAEVVLAAGVAAVAEHTGDEPVLDPSTPVVMVIEAVGPPDPAEDLAAVLHDAPGVLDVAVATDPARAARLWHVREVHTEVISRIGTPHKYDVTLPAPRFARFVEEIPSVVAEVDPSITTWLFGHVGDGNIHVNLTGVPDELEDQAGDAVLQRVVDDGGSISAEHGIGRAKRQWLTRARGPSEIDTMRRIKAALDPDGVLNPGVLLESDVLLEPDVLE